MAKNTAAAPLVGSGTAVAGGGTGPNWVCQTTKSLAPTAPSLSASPCAREAFLPVPKPRCHLRKSSPSILLSSSKSPVTEVTLTKSTYEFSVPSALRFTLSTKKLGMRNDNGCERFAILSLKAKDQC